LSKDADVIRAMKIFGTDAARKGAEFFNRRGGKKIGAALASGPVRLRFCDTVS